MTRSDQTEHAVARLRWWIASLVFASMVINYIDRQTFNNLAVYITAQNGWTLEQFATVLIGFRIAYTVMQAISGRVLDRLGTRAGLALSVSFYSLMAILTAGAQTLGQFRAVRFGLGAGEAANWPGAIKVSSEWFPPGQRAWAVALFDSGTALGGFVAPFLALALYAWFGDWRPVCLLTGSLGAIWVVAWLACNRVARRPRHLAAGQSPAEAKAGRPQDGGRSQLPRVGWRQLLGYRQTWGIMLGRFLFDPYWFFVGEWFPLLLKSRGFSAEQSVLGLAAPLAASIFGNFAGGALSSHLIRRGQPVGRSRRAVLACFAPTMIVLALSLRTSDYLLLLALFSYGNFAYAACSTMFLSLPADVFHPRAVASASGLAGTAAGAGTLVSTYLIGQTAGRYSFEPVILAASMVPPLAALVFVWLVRAPMRPDERQIVLEF